MDNLAQAQSNATSASESAAKLQESIPGLLQGLKQNLVSIYQKDNPLVQQRTGLLESYLNAPDQARASYLPANQPMVEGSPLNFSPTQLQAMVSSKQNAALAPLLGVNQMINAQYGNIGDIVGNAGDIYKSQLGGAQQRAQSAMDWYKQLVGEQQFQQQESRLTKASGSGGFDPSAILAAILAQNQQQQQEIDPAQFDEPDVHTSQSVGSLPQQIHALPPAGFSFGLPKGLTGPEGLTERVKGWGQLIWNGLTGG